MPEQTRTATDWLDRFADLGLLPEVEGEVLYARARDVRCVQVVGDRLIERTMLLPSGLLRYESLWCPPLAEGAEFPPCMPPLAPSEGMALGVEPAGDPAGRYHRFAAEVTLESPEALAREIARLRERAAAYNGPAGRGWEAALEENFFLLEPGLVATFGEWVEDQEVGWGVLEVVAGEGRGEVRRALVEQRDSRDDRFRYPVIRTPEGVAAEIRGKKDLLVHDWIWRFPIAERSWVEETEQGVVSLQLYREAEAVEVEAGRFWGCLRMATMNANGSSLHTYHPTAGLIVSEFSDVEGTPGRRELKELTLRTASER